MFNNTIVPTSDKAHYIEYEDNLFRCRQYGKEGLAFVYDKSGNPIISTLDGNNSLLKHKEYFIGHKYANNDSSSESYALYGIDGTEFLSHGKFKYISIHYIGVPLHFYAEDFHGNLYIYNDKLVEELKITKSNISLIEKQQDDLGIYYILRMNDDSESIISQSGSTIVESGKYNYIKRLTTDSFSFYKVGVLQKDKNGKPIKGKDGKEKYLSGIVALNGTEIIPPIYDMVYANGEEVKLLKGEEEYKVTADLKITKPFDCKLQDGLYYLVNRNGQFLNKLGYDNLTYDEDRYSYLATIGNFKTFIYPSGTEVNPIIDQMFSNAYSLMKTDLTASMTEFKRIIDLDKNLAYPSVVSQSYNNIGCVLFEQGDEDGAFQYFQRAVEIMPNNLTAANNLNELLNPPLQEQKGNASVSGWEIASNVLGALGNALNSYTSLKQNFTNNNYQEPIRSNRKVSKKQKRDFSEKSGKTLGQSNNERVARNTYHKYAGLLIDMSTFRDRYNDDQRRSIQKSMRAIRLKYNFNKTEWEDWDGSPR